MNELNHYLELFEERAAIIQYDGNYHDVIAEKRAFYEVVSDFCRKHGLRNNSFKKMEFVEGLRSLIKKRKDDAL